MTPDTSPTPYASAADMLARYDANTVGQLVSDTQQKVDPVTLLTNPVLLAALKTASGYLESACLSGRRYAVLDLQTLQAGGGAGAALLADVVCGLALGLLYRRRPNAGPRHPAAAEAWEFLVALRAGDAILPFAEAEAAGLTVDTVDDSVDVEFRNLTTLQAGRYYGRRANRWQ